MKNNEKWNKNKTPGNTTVSKYEPKIVNNIFSLLSP